MFARLAKLGARVLDRALDLLWDITMPVASKCPVCAFWRGVLAGIAATVAASWFPQ
jgi:hypothetical protein